MSLAEFPSPPALPKPLGRRVVGSSSLLPLGGDIPEGIIAKDNNGAWEKSPYLQCDHIPDEIVQVLTSTAHPIERPDQTYVKKTKDAKVCLRPIDSVWNHPLRRSKFKHLIDQPVCLTGAGRDVSFLCDALHMQKISKEIQPTQQSARKEMSPRPTGVSIEESLIPEEFYIVKNKGVLGLEYYEDKYTTLLEDDDKRLRVFPSMKPAGRLEVLQLSKVMDSMLKEAGVDEGDLKMEGPTQIHNLLSLLKTEQNIYNIVFHELIRQVSVDCAERGQLLAKIRQRYVMLLNKIPQQVMSLYEDLLAQRALDRSLTEEIIIFKNSIGELTNELSQVREHDLRVSKDAKQAQAELARALEEAKKNANLSEEYRELYELQRSRLEKHMVHLTEERDLWSSATYRLARKVIEENQLTLCRRLYINEKIWTKVVRHFIVLLASNDTADLSKIQETTETWRGHMARFDVEVQRNEESSKEKLMIILRDLEKWMCYFQQKVFVDCNYNEVHEEVTMTILQDMKSWEKMVNEELQQFEGSLLLNSQESLQTEAKLQKNWVHMAHKLLQRHRTIDGKEAPEQKAMEDVNNKVFELCEQYRRRVEGENGFAKVLMSFSGGLETWSIQLSALKLAPHGIRESDWLDTFQLIPEWITLADKALDLIGNFSSENDPATEQDEKVLLEDVFRVMQQWVLATTSGTERDNVLLTSEATALHTAMVQFMVNTLMLLTPDYPGKSESVTDLEEEEVTLQKIHEEALTLSDKVNRFSNYIISCCQEITENISMENKFLIDDGDSDYNPRGIDSLKNSCKEWIETCRLLIANLTSNSGSSATSLNQFVTSDPEDGAVRLEREGLEQEPVDPAIRISAIEFQGHRISRHHASQTNLASEQEAMMIIGHDGTIRNKLLKGEEIAMSPESALTVSRPGTPRSMDAFDSLISLDQLQKRLLSAELRAQEAEERSESLDEQLQEALQKIREFEKPLRVDNSSEKQEDIAGPVATTEQKITVTQVKKRPKSVKKQK